MFAGRCGGQTPAVTPVSFDPSVTPGISIVFGPAYSGGAPVAAPPSHHRLPAEPSVPPPRV